MQFIRFFFHSFLIHEIFVFDSCNVMFGWQRFVRSSATFAPASVVIGYGASSSFTWKWTCADLPSLFLRCYDGDAVRLRSNSLFFGPTEFDHFHEPIHTFVSFCVSPPRSLILFLWFFTASSSSRTFRIAATLRATATVFHSTTDRFQFFSLIWIGVMCTQLRIRFGIDSEAVCQSLSVDPIRCVCFSVWCRSRTKNIIKFAGTGHIHIDSNKLIVKHRCLCA